MAKIPDDITLSLHQVKFLEGTPDTTNWAKYLANFLFTQKWVKFMEIYLKNYVLCFPSCITHHEMCAWIYQTGPIGMGPWANLTCPEAMGHQATALDLVFLWI